MKSLVKMICATALLTLIAFGCSKVDQAPMVKESFQQYKSALLNQDGFTAYFYVDSNTKAYYDEILDKVMTASESETKNMSFGTKMIVTMARHSISNQQLREMNGEELFIYAVENGWIGKESISNLEITVSSIEKNIAETHVVNEEGEAPFGFTFRKEDKTWRIDLTSMFSRTEMVLEEQIKESGVDEDVFIYAMLTQTSGFRPDESIWEPVNP